MRWILVATLATCCAIVTARPSFASVETDSIEAPILDPDELCTAATISAAVPILPKEALRSGAGGWTVVRYDLDGTGHAQSVEIVASAPGKIFDKASVDSIKRSRYRAGFAKAGCKAVIVFSTISKS